MNPIGVYGKVEKIRIYRELVKKRPTEVDAAAHIKDPDHARFIPAPDTSEYIWCSGCRMRHHYTKFDRDSRYVERFGRRSECKEYRKKQRLAESLKRREASRRRRKKRK